VHFIGRTVFRIRRIVNIILLQAGDNPQRIPPTRPRVCCGNRLESFEERERDKIDYSLFSFNREQMQNEQQHQKKLELSEAEAHRHQLQKPQAVTRCWRTPVAHNNLSSTDE